MRLTRQGLILAVFAAVACLTASQAFAADLVHTTANLSQGRAYDFGVSLGTKAYFGGGITTAGVGTRRASTSMMRPRAPGPPPTFPSPGSRRPAAVGTQVLFAGGKASENSTTIYSLVDIYNTATGIWTTSNLSQAKGDFFGVTVGHKAYFGGGSLATTQVSNIMDVYDADTRSWSTVTMPHARTGYGVAVLGSKILYAGGGDASGPLSSIDIYDTQTGAWASTSISVPRYNDAFAVAGTKAIFAGGSVASGAATGAVNIYDSATGIWSSTTLPVRLERHVRHRPRKPGPVRRRMERRMPGLALHLRCDHRHVVLQPSLVGPVRHRHRHRRQHGHLRRRIHNLPYGGVSQVDLYTLTPEPATLALPGPGRGGGGGAKAEAGGEIVMPSLGAGL